MLAQTPRYHLSGSIIAIAAWCFFSTASESATDKFLENFFRTTGLREGEYELVSGSEACDSGDLRVSKVNSDYTLMLGVRPLVFDLSEPTSSQAERDCQMDSTTSFSRSKISGRRQEFCKGQVPTNYHLDVEITKAGITYHRKVFSRVKVYRDERCVLKRVGDITD